MLKKRHRANQAKPDRWYRGADIPLSIIRRFARQVAERFHPEKIVLFGSYAYGKPHADSDVDILVVMPARDERAQAIRICLAVPRCFPMDLIVRTPENLRWRLDEGDWFLREIVTKGKVLHEATDQGMGTKSRGRLRRRNHNQPHFPARP